MSMDSQRLDQWLWHARFLKSRSQATALCRGQRVRVNRAVVDRAHHPLRVGDVLTFPQGNRIRVVRVLGLAVQRGSACAAGVLYEDLLPVT